MEYSAVFAFCMLAVGLALIVVELFIPSGGFITVLAVVALAASVYSAYNVWWDDHIVRFWWFVGCIIGLIPITAGGTLTVISRTKLGNRVFLEAPKLEEVTPQSLAGDGRDKLIGKIGQTQTIMAPGGLVIVEGKRHHAETEGQMLDPGETVKVIAVKGNRIVVRPGGELPQPESQDIAPPKTEEPSEESPSEIAQAETDPSRIPLDFEIPES